MCALVDVKVDGGYSTFQTPFGAFLAILNNGPKESTQTSMVVLWSSWKKFLIYGVSRFSFGIAFGFNGASRQKSECSLTSDILRIRADSFFHANWSWDTYGQIRETFGYVCGMPYHMQILILRYFSLRISYCLTSKLQDYFFKEYAFDTSTKLYTTITYISSTLSCILGCSKGLTTILRSFCEKNSYEKAKQIILSSY